MQVLNCLNEVSLPAQSVKQTRFNSKFELLKLSKQMALFLRLRNPIRSQIRRFVFHSRQCSQASSHWHRYSVKIFYPKSFSLKDFSRVLSLGTGTAISVSTNPKTLVRMQDVQFISCPSNESTSLLFFWKDLRRSEKGKRFSAFSLVWTLYRRILKNIVCYRKQLLRQDHQEPDSSSSSS